MRYKDLVALQQVIGQINNIRDDEISKLLETCTKIEKLTGYSMDRILEMLTEGWTLKEPETSSAISNIVVDTGKYTPILAERLDVKGTIFHE